jgi:hypothetical protein
MQSASRRTAEVAAKAAPRTCRHGSLQPADTGSPEPADMATPEPADMATPEPADRAASNAADMAPQIRRPTRRRNHSQSTYVTASATKAPSDPSTPRRRIVCRRSGQGSRLGVEAEADQYALPLIMQSVILQLESTLPTASCSSYRERRTSGDRASRNVVTPRLEAAGGSADVSPSITDRISTSESGSM